MKKLIVTLTILGAAATGLAQPGNVLIHTNPKLPARDLLDRLDLKLAWAAKLPVDGLRDGFYSVQLLPGKNLTLLVAQTFSGSVIAINADTGDTLWRTKVGLPYRQMQPVGFNEQAIFVWRQLTLYALDWRDGTQLMYTVDHDSDLPVYGLAMVMPPTAAATADDQWLFACFSDRLIRYKVPNFRAVPKKPADGKRQPSPQLVRDWDFPAPGYMSQPPALTRTNVAVIADDGGVAVLKKTTPADENPEPLWHFKTEGVVVAKAAAHRSMLYIPCQDFFLYAYNTANGKVSWRFAGQAPIDQSPAATDADVFMAASKGGLYRLDRETGMAKWSSSDAVKFLATNQRFVYALDGVGNMLIVDYFRGKVLAAWDSRDWLVPVPNQLTDRIYMANHDGQIMCLHHREQIKPMALRTSEEDVKPKVKTMKKKAPPIPPPGAGDGKGNGGQGAMLKLGNDVDRTGLDAVEQAGWLAPRVAPRVFTRG